MLNLSPTELALAELAAVFASILILLRLKVSLWKAMLVGTILLAILRTMPLKECLLLPLQTAGSSAFISMEIMLFGILALSAIQEATGQSRRLVNALDRYISQPKLRIIIFPALIGLLPMPGGALFSCPMLDAAAHGLKLSGKRKSLINYWFRHIWETAWPLYPGYILACSLIGIPLLSMLKFTFPFVIFALIAGWFFFLRDIQPEDATQENDTETSTTQAMPKGSIKNVIYESLPLLITIGGAFLFSLILNALAPTVPSQYAFILSLFLAVLTAIYQGRDKFSKPLIRLVFTSNLCNMLLLVYVIFLFKDAIGLSGLITDISLIGHNKLLFYPMFVILPFISGMLTGILVGTVGACFAILLALIGEAGLSSQLAPLMVVALISGHAGQMASPLHVCVIVTCEYFHSTLGSVFKKMVGPLLVQLGYGILWGLILLAFGAHF